jgi:hypothetical protein
MELDAVCRECVIVYGDLVDRAVDRLAVTGQATDRER